MARLLSGTQVILDGELALPDATGRTVFLTYWLGAMRRNTLPLMC
jgi:hypothetical protein